MFFRPCPILWWRERPCLRDRLTPLLRWRRSSPPLECGDLSPLCRSPRPPRPDSLPPISHFPLTIARIPHPPFPIPPVSKNHYNRPDHTTTPKPRPAKLSITDNCGLLPSSGDKRCSVRSRVRRSRSEVETQPRRAWVANAPILSEFHPPSGPSEL
jgi:hypothetical protein